MSLCQAPADVLQISLWQFDRWDFLAENFFSYFDLDPNCLLSDDVKQYLAHWDSMQRCYVSPLNFVVFS